MARRPRVREQHIAVFGGSGSGKTVLVSSFYGAAQEQDFLKSSLFHLVADDTGQGNRLRQNYLGMKNSGKVPDPTRFASTPYRFSIKLKGRNDTSAGQVRPFDELRLVWHDYPGEWFEDEPSSAEESKRRLDTFRRLLRSDVALLMVDGQKLIDYAGEEEKYLKDLIWSIRDGLLHLRDDLLDEGKPLEQFPRIWIVALSKADLHPQLDVHGFQDLIVEKAAGDLVALQEAIQGLVQIPQALSVGDDFMLLSSAKFEPGRIEVSDRVGLDLILPVALLLPLERLVGWLERFEIPRIWADRLAENADVIAAVLVGAKGVALISKIPKIGAALATLAVPVVKTAVQLGGDQVKELNDQARKKQDYLAEVLTQFRLDLDQGVRDNHLVKRDR